MAITTSLAYLLIFFYIILERLLRRENASSLETGQFDRGSSQIIWAVGIFNTILILVVPILNSRQIGYLNSFLLHG